MTKEAAYEQATLENLSNPNGTRQDIIYAAMDIWGKDILRWIIENKQDFSFIFSPTIDQEIKETYNEYLLSKL